MSEWLISLDESTIIHMIFAFCYALLGIFLVVYMCLSERRNKKLWETHKRTKIKRKNRWKRD